jgi:hypothetical protein
MARRFPPPWSVEDIGGCFAVKASNGRPLIFIYYGLATKNGPRPVGRVGVWRNVDVGQPVHVGVS